LKLIITCSKTPFEAMARQNSAKIARALGAASIREPALPAQGERSGGTREASTG